MSGDAGPALLAALGARLGLPGLRADAAGTCVLTIDGALDLRLVLAPGGATLVLFAVLGTLTGTMSGTMTGTVDTPRLAADMLRANYLWRGTDGATLSLDPEDDAVLLARRLPLAALDAPGLEDHLERFVRIATTWRARLSPPSGRCP